jgi:hypothetical protein
MQELGSERKKSRQESKEIKTRKSKMVLGNIKDTGTKNVKK